MGIPFAGRGKKPGSGNGDCIRVEISGSKTDWESIERKNIARGLTHGWSGQLAWIGSRTPAPRGGR
jgi:hypothetical protein